MKIQHYLIALCMLGGFARIAYPQSVMSHDVANGHIKFAQVTVAGNQLHYAYAGDPRRSGVMFVHGTPGSWRAFQQYLENTELQEDFLLVSVDRLGWGKSTLPRRQIDGDFELQSRSIITVMDQFPDTDWIIVGHSLGASIAPKIALHAPQRVAGLLLLAGSFDPKLGQPRWYNRAAHTWLAKWLIPASLARSNDEIMPLSKQLSMMSAEIDDTELEARLVVIQGQKDNLVSPRNTRYVEKNWRGKFADIDLIELPEAGHFLPWENTRLVLEHIRKLAAAR